MRFTVAAGVFLLKTITIDNPTLDHGEAGRDVLELRSITGEGVIAEDGQVSQHTGHQRTLA